MLSLKTHAPKITQGQPSSLAPNLVYGENNDEKEAFGCQVVNIIKDTSLETSSQMVHVILHCSYEHHFFRWSFKRNTVEYGASLEGRRRLLFVCVCVCVRVSAPVCLYACVTACMQRSR